MPYISKLKVPPASFVSPDLFADALLDLGLTELSHQLSQAVQLWLNDAHDEGYDEGYGDGYGEGCRDGHDSGYYSGYDDGYSEGYTTAREKEGA